MKLRTLVEEDPSMKLVMIINEVQYRNLIQNLLPLQEQHKIRNTGLIKTNSNAQK